MDTMEDLEERVRDAREALSADHSDRPQRLHKLSYHLLNRYFKSRQISDLEEAIQLQQEAVNSIPQDHPGRLKFLLNLCVYLGRKFDATESQNDLDESTKANREALAAAPETYPHRAVLLNKLGVNLIIKFSRTGEMSALEEGIQFQQDAVNTASENDPNREDYISNLGALFVNRWEATGATADLEDSIRLLRTALDLVPKDNLRRLNRLCNLGNVLHLEYTTTGEIADLGDAIEVTHEAVNVAPKDSRDYLSVLGNYGDLLADRYVKMGTVSDLEDAIQIGQKVHEAFPQDDEDRPTRLTNFAIHLSYRYRRFGTADDLNKAIQVGTEAASTSPDDDYSRAKVLSNLGIILKIEYFRTEDAEDLQKAIQVQRQAVEATRQNSPDLVDSLHNLAGLLTTRYQLNMEMSDLEEAIKIGQQVIGLIQKDHPNRPAYLNTLGLQLGQKFLKTGQMTEIEDAIRIGRETIEATEDDHPERATRLTNLGNRFHDKFSKTGAMEDLEDAIACYQPASRHPNMFDITRITAGRELLRCLAKIPDWERAYETVEIAMQLVPKLISRTISNTDKQDVLSQVYGLSTDAAAVALLANKGPLVAFNFLEQGRGLVAASLEETRSDVLELQGKHPELAKQFTRLRKETEELSARHNNSGDQNREALWGTHASGHFEVQKELDKLLIEIRKQPEFEDFLTIPNEQRIKEAATHGPITIINTSEYRCDAIIIERHQVRSIALPHLRIADIRARSQENDLGHRKILNWLWETIADPILSALGITQPPSDDNWPHIWWIPTGPLSIFPLHAAGNHYKGSTKTVIDRAMSSYSTSIKAIIHSRRRPGLGVASSATEQALLVAMDQTPEISGRLQYAPSEISEVHSLCKSLGLNPIEPGRNKEDVVSHLPLCKVFHFAGHGQTHRRDPSLSSLLLQDWQTDPLMVSTLLEIDIQQYSPFLAYLSACGTGRITYERYLDENVHLISACQLAGFRHVIGTLWEANDEVCVDVAKSIYEGMVRGDKADESVCRGLHKVTRELRDRWLWQEDAAQHQSNGAMNVPKGNHAGIWNKDGDKRGEATTPRDFVLCLEDEDETASRPMLWVPYVHYGV